MEVGSCEYYYREYKVLNKVSSAEPQVGCLAGRTTEPAEETNKEKTKVKLRMGAFQSRRKLLRPPSSLTQADDS